MGETKTQGGIDLPDRVSSVPIMDQREILEERIKWNDSMIETGRKMIENGSKGVAEATEELRALNLGSTALENRGEVINIPMF